MSARVLVQALDGRVLVTASEPGGATASLILDADVAMSLADELTLAAEPTMRQRAREEMAA